MAATALSSATFPLWSGQVVAQPIFEWAGPYVGGSVGVAVGAGPATLSFPDSSGASYGVFFTGNVPHFDGALDSLTAYTPWPTSAGLGDAGLVGTINAGYNFQIGGLVFGLEGDATGFGSHSAWNWHLSEPGGNTRISDLTVNGGLDSLFTIRPRVGIAVDRLLMYGTGGLALGQASLQTSASLDQDAGKGVANWSGSNSGWKSGFVVGAGAEYALTPRTTFKLEGLYYDLGSMSATATGQGSWKGSPVTVEPYTATIKLTGTIVRAGLNVHF